VVVISRPPVPAAREGASGGEGKGGEAGPGSERPPKPSCRRRPVGPAVPVPPNSRAPTGAASWTWIDCCGRAQRCSRPRRLRHRGERGRHGTPPSPPSTVHVALDRDPARAQFRRRRLNRSDPTCCPSAFAATATSGVCVEASRSSRTRSRRGSFGYGRRPYRPPHAIWRGMGMGWGPPDGQRAGSYPKLHSDERRGEEMWRP
jgi:hypothetical protein